MGKQTFSDDGQFIPIPGITTYNFVVIGAGGGGASYTNNTRSGPGGAGGNGALVKTTFTNVAIPVNIKIGGGGGGGLVTAGYGEPAGFGGGAGLTQVFNANINIIAAGGSGAAPLSYYQPEAVSGINGVNGGNPGGNDNSINAPGDGAASANGTGGSGDSFYGGGQGGSFNPTGAGGAGGVDLLINPVGGAGGGGAGINGVTGLGGFIAGFAAGGTNGGGSANRAGGGGSAGYGGGAGAKSSGGVFVPGNSGSSAVLYNGANAVGANAVGANAVGANAVWDAAPYNGLQYGLGGLGGTQGQPNGLMGKDGYVEISWDEPISNICFPAGTPIKTDQGMIAIEHLQPSIHTIDRQRIQCITHTKSVDPYLICFEKNALGKNYPTQKTIMSKDHKLLYDGKLAEAYRFLALTDKVQKVKYSGETLYNVLLETYGIMKVNNLECETLHPQNAIAKLYLAAPNLLTTFSEKVEPKYNPNVKAYAR